MNVTRATSLKPLADLYTLCVMEAAVTVTPTEDGFMLTRPNTLNPELRAELLKLADKANRDDLRYLIKQAWGCGIDNNGGLHVMGV